MTTNAAEIDAPPPTEKKVKVFEVQPWNNYFKPATLSKLLHKKMLIGSILIGVQYLWQFILCLISVSYYDSNERLISCGVPGLTAPADASRYYDVVLLLFFIYHIIEWIRSTILLVTVCIGVNFMWVWYITMINSLFGIAVFLYAHYVRFSPHGKACNEWQPTRSNWIVIEIIMFWILFFFYSFPMIIIRCCNRQKLEQALDAPSEDEGESEDAE